MGERERRPPSVVPLDPPLVTVRFKSSSTPSWGPDATDEVARDKQAHWDELTSLFPGLTIVPLFERVPASVIEDLVARGRRMSPSYRPAPFLAMFRVNLPPRARWGEDAPRDGNLAAALRKVMLQHLPIESVSVETLLAPPPLQDDPASAFDMEYLDPAPKGIDVKAVWGEPGGMGGGEVLADVELGWYTGHVEFTGVTFTELPDGEQVDDHVPHGTMVLSVVLARLDGKEVVGVAPLVTDVVLSSEKRVVSGAIVTEAAILDAIVALVTSGANHGSVLLLEVQKFLKDFDTAVTDLRLGPGEMKMEVFLVIQLAVANHIVVVEAAGNGATEDAGIGVGLDLDTYSTPEHPIPLKPELVHGDSGAILVGQSVWEGLPGDVGNFHKAIDFGCTGTRIDCFGWGFDVAAASAVTTVDPFSGTFTSGFGGTSSASAMIAGAALVVQGLVRNGAAGVLGYLPPLPMRALLRDRGGLNTPLANGDIDVIGVMPDLSKILTRLAELPDLYIRDNLLDHGDPHSGHLSHSPDIIVKTAALPAGVTPDDAFGESSGTADDDELSDNPITGPKAFVYVRVRNRGGTDVSGAKVTVWYADAGTLLQPKSWSLIGEASRDVSKGDTLHVFGPIEWNGVPAQGHYCFIALVEHAADPGFLSSTFSIPATTALTVPADFNDFEYYKTYIRNENNAAWRNFDVVDVPAESKSVGALTANVGGAEKAGEEDMDLRVESRLPAEATLQVELPEELARVMKLPRHFKEHKPTRSWRGKVAAVGVTRLGLARLPAGALHRVKLRVKLARGLPRRCEVSLVQLHRGQVVGRVTWRLKPAPKA